MSENAQANKITDFCKDKTSLPSIFPPDSYILVSR